MWLAPFVSALLFAVQEPYTLKIDVPVVSVDVTVADARGALINDLGKADFQIFEDGKEQEIRFFSPVSAPYNVFLLFDRSGSTQDNWPFMRNAVVQFIKDLRPQDRIALGAFDEKFEVSVPWTGDHDRVIAGLDKALNERSGNATRFYDALDRTLRRQFRNVSGRRAVVVLTDGKDTDYYFEDDGDLKDVLRASAEQRIPVYIVALRDPADARVVFPRTREYLIESRQFMETITGRSGGQVLFPRNIDDVKNMYERIGRALGTSYSLGYVPAVRPADKRRRRVEVKTRMPGLTVTQSRSEYVPE